MMAVAATKISSLQDPLTFHIVRALVALDQLLKAGPTVTMFFDCILLLIEFHISEFWTEIEG